MADLTDATTGALQAELHRRRVSALSGMEDIYVGDLTVSPSRLSVFWRGEWVRLRPKEMETLQAIASAHPRGVTCIQLACALYESGSQANLFAVRVYVSELRKLLPGLLNVPVRGRGRKNTTYHLEGLDTPRRTPVRIVGEPR